ncbi:MAG: hypothetical protein H0W74_05880 [Sphingosinicella sp.]|nr:hypothetical protein [Sphingosinicella sp.]
MSRKKQNYLSLAIILVGIILFIHSCINGEPDFLLLAVMLAALIPIIWENVQSMGAASLDDEVLELDSGFAIGGKRAEDHTEIL